MSYNKLKKKLILVITISAPFSAPSIMSAQPNTIVFFGAVSQQTCEITINGDSANPVVLLPAVAASELATPRSVAKETAFTLGLKGCDGSAFVSYTLFSGNNIGDYGTLKNLATDGALNVGFQLKNMLGGYEIDVTNFQYASREPGVKVNAGETEGSWDYAVQYISIEGGATPGRVLGTVQYAVVYE
ncbi:fimbrial protein [Shewanella sp. DNRA4]|uniref:fimbrial protein n=1 Tax=Shewanella sp. DNRA4 TaxID=2723055 RepID=UPI001B7CF726|nr:fimbrial protein [Shewanella sp. DNRA4]